jgi:hypothetical protein
MKFEFEEIESLNEILVESLSARFTYLFDDHLIKELYPILSQIAKSFLSLPATSVPCETLFSQCGITLTELKNRLYPSTLEKLKIYKKIDLFEICKGISLFLKIKLIYLIY